MAGLNHHQSRTGQLGELQQEEGRGIELQVPPAVIGDHRIATARVVLGVQAIERGEGLLEALDLVGLAQHRVE